MRGREFSLETEAEVLHVLEGRRGRFSLEGNVRKNRGWGGEGEEKIRGRGGRREERTGRRVQSKSVEVSQTRL